MPLLGVMEDGEYIRSFCDRSVSAAEASVLRVLYAALVSRTNLHGIPSSSSHVQPDGVVQRTSDLPTCPSVSVAETMVVPVLASWIGVPSSSVSLSLDHLI